MTRQWLTSAALVCTLALAGCASSGGDATVSASKSVPASASTSASASASSEPSPGASAKTHLSVDDVAAVVPLLPGATWISTSQMALGADADLTAGEGVEYLASQDSSLSPACEQYKWGSNIVSGSDVGNTDTMRWVGELVDSGTTVQEAEDFADVLVREFPSSEDANAFLDGFVAAAQACPGADGLASDFGEGWKTISVTDTRLSSGARLVESAAVGESDEAGEGTFISTLAVENIVVAVLFGRHNSGQLSLESTSGSDLAMFYADALQ